MNILYIGPYRQLDYIGQVSETHIESILKTVKSSDILITRPLYLDTSLSNNKPKTATEKAISGDIDILIQYMPIDFISIQKNIKNIVIPIINPRINNLSHDYEYKKLNWCDKILVEDDKHKHMLKLCGVKSSIEIYEEKFETDNYQKFNLDSIENNYKFGFIGHYQNNKQIIHKIIDSFLLSARYQHNIKLYLFLRGSDQDKQDVDNYIDKMKKQLNMPIYINKIDSLFGMWNRQESLIALNSIDCFISLNDDYRQTLYEKFFTINAEMTDHKFIINRQNVQTIEVPDIYTNKSHEYKNTLNSISTTDLSAKILSAQSSQQKNKKTDYPSLGNIICKQAR